MKRGLNIFVLGLILISFSMSFVSATNGPVEMISGVIEGVYEITYPVLKIIVGDADDTEFFLAKIMLAVIIFAFIFKIVEKIPLFDNKGAFHVLVSIAVSFLSIRWIGDADIVRAILLPYSTIGVTITAGLPFIIWFYFTEVLMQGTGRKIQRKISWISFMVVFVALWITRAGDVAGGAVAPIGGPLTNFAYIYLVVAGLGLVASLMDGSIQKTLRKMKIERIHGTHKNILIEQIKNDMKKRRNAYADEADGGENYTSIYGTQSGHKGFEHDMKKLKEKMDNLASESN